MRSWNVGPWVCSGSRAVIAALILLVAWAALPLATDTAAAAAPSTVVVWGLDNAPPAGGDFVAASAGADHSLALHADGSIAAWGSNTYGQASPPPGTGYTAIAAGWWHSLALRADGSIAAWGDNTYGQASPPPGNDFVRIAAGRIHSLALRSNGSLVAWGNNNWGQATPPDGTDYVDIAAGGYHSLARHADGSLAGWGDNFYGQASPPIGTGYTAIDAGGSHSLALRGDGSIAAWGYDGDGQSSAPPGTAYTAVAAGESHSLALMANGVITGWGYDDHGQAAPPAGAGYLAISAGSSHSLALIPDPTAPQTSITTGPAGVVFDNDASFAFTSSEPGSTFECLLEPEGNWESCLSPKDYVDLFDGPHTFWVRATDKAGNTDPTPASRSFTVDTGPPDTQVDFAPPATTPTNDPVFRFSASNPASTFHCRLDPPGGWDPCSSPQTYSDLADGAYTFAVRAIDQHGQIDATPATVSFTVQTPEPAAIVAWGSRWQSAPDGNLFTAISAGGNHMLALRSDGSIVGWGSNTYGQATPPAGDDFIAVSAGGSHSLALRSDGTVAAWGDNSSGAATPPLGNDFVAVDAGQGTSVALRYDGSIVGWGQTSPPAGTGFTAVSIAITGGVALRNDGSIAAWPPGLTPPAGTGWTAIAAGAGHRLALAGDGSIVGWGAGAQAIPPAGTGYRAIAAGYDHSLAIRSDSSVAAWGLNDHGQALAPGGMGYVAISGGWNDSLALVHDTTAPETTITSGPTGPTADDYVLFEAASEPWVTFECKLDPGGSWSACSPSVGYASLPDGTYTFSVRAIDQAGNVDQSPDARQFTIDRTGPDMQIEGAPPAWTNDPDIELGFSGSPEPAVAFECAFVSGPDPWQQPHDWAACTPPMTYAGLTDGEYLFLVRGFDALGNVGPAANAHFHVDTVAPDTQIAGPMDLPNPSSRAFKLSSEAGASFECSIDGGPFAPCGQIVEVGPLANGEHTLAARAIDSAGNADPVPASITFTIAIAPAPTPTVSPGPTPAPTLGTIRGDQAFVLGWSNDLYLACTKLDLYLIDVLPAGRARVAVSGAADLRLAGQTLDILLDGKRVGQAVVGPAGAFAAKVKAPSARRRSTARYQARAGDTRSQNLKLQRRMVAAGLTRRGSILTLKGRITRPFARKLASVQLQRYLACGRTQTLKVKQARPNRLGAFSISFPVPAGPARALMYRATTEVASRAGGSARVRTYTLPRAIDLPSAGG